MAPVLSGDSHKDVYPTPTLSQNPTFDICGIDTGVEYISTTDTDPKSILQELKLKCNKNVVISHINVNSIRNKFDNLKNIITGNVDILLVSETKLDDSFPAKQFLMEGYSLPFRLDRSGRAGGLLLFVREDIPSKALKTNFSREGIFLEINLKKCKWLLFGGYNPHKDFIKDFLSEVSEQLDNFMQNYENFMLIGDFNSEVTESPMIDFTNMYNLKNLISDPTCFKNPDRPTSIDVMLTNTFKLFKFSNAIETGISDFHLMTTTVMKAHYQRMKPRIISYRNYKNYNHNNFRRDFQKLMQTYSETGEDINYDIFEKSVLEILDKMVPLKTKYLRGNHQPFVNKELSKAIMNRTKLRNIYNKNKTDTNRTKYVRQRNYCVNLLRRVKRDYYNNLNTGNITDNKKFWKSVKPSFTDKINTNEQINLVHNGTIVSDNTKVANIMADFFSNVVDTLNISDNTDIISNTDHIVDTVENAIVKYAKHPSITNIKDRQRSDRIFSLSHTTVTNVRDIILNTKVNKATPKNGIPTKILKLNYDLFAPIICDNFNDGIDNRIFPEVLKYAEIKPNHKKDDRCDKENYRPISLLPIVSKIYERILYSQIDAYFNDILSPLQCGFRKFHSAQHCLLVLLEKWKIALDSKQKAGIILTDLSKAFDCIRHDMFIAKCHAYGMDKCALKYIYDYLSNRKQRVRINDSFSEWKNIQYGVPQGSILGPLFFNIFMCDLFYTLDENVVNYADDNTPYAMRSTTEEVILQLEKCTNSLLQWISQNFLKANPDKSHLLLSDRGDKIVKIQSEFIRNTHTQKLLGITIDSELKFDIHVKNLCNKASLKLHALSRISRFMNPHKLKMIMKAFVLSQFNYCPLVWMFHSRELNNRINRIHERALRIAYKDQQSTFHELLDKDCAVTIHHRNIQILATEIYKFMHNLSPQIMSGVFKLNDSKHNLRVDPTFASKNIRTVHYGLQSICYLAPRIWTLVPKNIKESPSLKSFKRGIKRWVPYGCPCRLCQQYVQGLGFI